MRRITVCAITAMLVTAGWFTASAIASVHVAASGHRASQYEWCDQFDNLCWHDPNGGGTDTVIVDEADNGHASFDWAINSDAICNGTTIYVQDNCPGGWISQNLIGDEIVTLKNASSGLCLGASNATSWQGEMKACDSGGQTYTTVFVYQPGRSYGSCTGARFWSLQWNTNHTDGGQPTNGGNNSPVVIGDFANTCDNLWDAFGS